MDRSAMKTLPIRTIVLAALAGGLVLLHPPAAAGQTLTVTQAVRAPAYFRLQLKHNDKYLDARNCTDAVGLNPGSDFEGGACQLWRLVPVADGWSRLQLKHGGKYLDMSFCGDNLGMNPGSDFDGGACQLWRLVPVADGWSRLQVKHGGKYLDAKFCGDDVGMNPGSTFDGGACQLWRMVPERVIGMTRVIEPSGRPLGTQVTGIRGRTPSVLSPGVVIGGTTVPDTPGTPGKRGFDENGQPYIDQPMADGSIKRIQQNGVTIIKPDGSKTFVPLSVIRSNAPLATPPSLPSDPLQGREWMERHNKALLDLIRGLVRSDEVEMSKFQAGERTVAGDDLFAQITYRTNIADFLAQER
jgi:Ricin-type beta-trefoil lectin domain-like